MIKISASGDYSKTLTYMKKIKEFQYMNFLRYLGERGVEALRESTPKATGKTSESWRYKIKRSKNQTIISWENTNIVDGTHVALVLLYGHVTKSGGFIEGTDYVTPAIKPLFDNFITEIDNYLESL